MKALIFDSGPLINLSMNGLLFLIEELKKISEIKFFITREVKYETVDRPLGVPRFELGALRIRSLIDSKVLELPQGIGITESELKKTTRELMKIANSLITVRGKRINILSEAEVSCLSLSKKLSSIGVKNVIAIDERTTRLLGESPENLENIMSSKLHEKVNMEKEKLSSFSEFQFIRSTELVYVAYKKGLIKIKDPKVLEALLYATKYKGSSVSFEEINVLKKL